MGGFSIPKKGANALKFGIEALKWKPHTKQNCFGVRLLWERICFAVDLFRGMVEGVFPEVGLGLAGDPLAQEIAQDGTAGAHEHKGQHHHAAPRLRVAEQQKKAEDQQKQADSQEKGKDFLGFHPCLPHSLGPGVASETRTRERGRKGM